MLWCVLIALRTRTFFLGEPFPLIWVVLGQGEQNLVFFRALVPFVSTLYPSWIGASDTGSVSMPFLLAWCFLFAFVNLVVPDL